MATANLRDKLEANIAANGGNLVLPDPAIAVAGIQWLLDNLVRGSSFSIQGAKLSGDALQVDGRFSLFGVAFDISATFQAGSNIGMTLSANLAAGQTPNLSAVVGHFYTDIDPPEIDLTTLDLSAGTSDTSFTVTVGLSGGSQGLALGARGIRIRTVSGSLSYDKKASKVNADLKLTADIGPASVVLDYQPPGDLALSGTIASIPLGAAMNAFLASAFGFPATFPTITLNNTSVSINKSGSNYKASLSTVVDDWGDLELEVDKAADWQVAAGFALLKSFRLDSISPVFSALPLDGASLLPGALLLASYTGANPFDNPVLAKLSVVEGISFHAGLDLQASGGGLEKALSFFATSHAEIDIDGAITDPLSNSYLQATVDASATIPGTGIAIADPALRLTLAPSIQVRGNVLIPIGSDKITLTGGMTVSTAEANLFVDAKFPELNNPLHFQGVTLKEIGGSLGVAFEPPGAALTLQGDFLVGSHRADAAFAFSFGYTPPVEVYPRLLSAKFSQLDLPTMISALAPQATVPSELDSISFRDFYIYWAGAQVSLPDGTTANPGFGFNSLMDFFGWTAYAALDIKSDSGFSGAAALSPISIGGGAFRFTGNGQGHLGVKDGGATLSIDTSKAAFSFSAAAYLLGITGSASGSFSTAGVVFSVAADTGGGYNYLKGQVSGNFSSNLSNPQLSFSADIGFRFKVSTPRLRFPGTGFYLGTLHIDAGFDGSMATALKGTNFSLDASGGVSWRSTNPHFSLPTIRVQPRDLANFADTIANAIAQQAEDLFHDLWSSAQDYINLIKDGVLTDIDPNPLGVLISVFHVSEGAAIELLKQIGGLIPHVDTNFPPHGDTKGPHVDTHGDTKGPHIDTHLDKKVFGIHTDTPHGDTAPHIDTPHVDTAPHIDTPSTHVDFGGSRISARVLGTVPGTRRSTGTGGHLDTGGRHVDRAEHLDRTTHVDQPVPHVDSHADRNVNGVHVDSPHADTGAHVDARPHADAGRGQHLDVNVPHVDSGRVAGTPRKTGPHADVGGQHIDEQLHVDRTLPHVDAKTPHVDTGAGGNHVDAGGHADGQPHLDSPAGRHIDTDIPHIDSRNGGSAP